jgi:hypothetical protein
MIHRHCTEANYELWHIATPLAMPDFHQLVTCDQICKTHLFRTNAYYVAITDNIPT